MKKIVLAACMLALAPVAAAFADPIAERQANMKSNGRAVGTLSRIAQGQAPFDAATVMEALRQLDIDAQALDADRLFPEGTEEGGGTTAAPTIWSDREGFKAAIEKFRTDAAAAVAADPQDLASMQAQFKTVSANCGACHQTYRVRR